jgi:hypothetical protein
VVAGILARGIDLRPRHIVASSQSSRWIALVLTFVVTFGTFFIVREALYLSPEEATLAKDAGATLDEQQAEAKTVDLMNNKPAGKITLAEEYLHRFRRSGKWFAWLLWPEMRFVGSAGIKGSVAMTLLSSLDTAMGWVIIALLLVTLWHAMRRRDWLWLGLAVYCAALCINWPNPNARYLVPVAPLVLWGVIRGVQLIALRDETAPEDSPLPMPTRRLPRAAIVGFTFSVFVCSGILYATDVKVAHADDFYAAYEGRQYQGLIAASYYLNRHSLDDRELGVSEKYINLGRPRASKSGLRVAVMLTNRVVQVVPMNKADEPVVPKTINYNRRQRIRWYLYQQPISPWRVWHFRVPAWLQEAMTKEPVGPESGGWVLYRVVDGKWVGIDLREVRAWPTRVPGL